MREVESPNRIIEELAQCFVDGRDQRSVKHRVKELLAQRINGIVLGYVDLNDHDRLRLDPVHALLAGKEDLTGEERAKGADRGKALAGRATLNRLELGACGGDERYCKIVPVIRQRLGKKVRIVVRADSGFARESIMSWCEQHGVYYCFGLAKNAVLKGLLKESFEKMHEQIAAGECSLPYRQFVEFGYGTRESWSRFRRVLGKVEVLDKGDNPRFVVSNLPAEGFGEEDAQRFAPAR